MGKGQTFREIRPVEFMTADSETLGSYNSGRVTDACVLA